MPDCSVKECGDDGCGKQCLPGCGLGAQCVAGQCEALVPDTVDAITADPTNGGDESSDGSSSKCSAGFGVGASALPFALLLTGLGAAFLGRRRRD